MNQYVELMEGNGYEKNGYIESERVNHYAELKQLVKEKGLLARQPVYYMPRIWGVLGMFVLSVLILLLVDNLWIQLLNAVFLAFIFTQSGFIGHDAGHQQIFHNNRMNDVIGLIFGNLLIGLSMGWWVDKHNQHHSHPNHLDLDPDIDIPILAFCEEQLHDKQGIARLIVKYQAYFFIPLLLFQGYSMRFYSAKELFERRVRNHLYESILLAAHFVLYLGLVFYSLEFWHAILFVLVHQGLFGLYMSSVFATNHKGMAMTDENHKLDFLREQVLTARNVRANPFTDYWYGGLNYQIEHHLFPRMPRRNLNQAQKITRAYCQAHSIDYYETGVFESYREILQHLHEISLPLRTVKV